MERYPYSFLVLLLSCAGCMAVALLPPMISITDGGAGTGIVREGTDTVIRVACAMADASMPSVDQICSLGIDTSTTAEVGYDVPDLSGYTCTIKAGTAGGTIDIPLTDDTVIDTAEMLVLKCDDGIAGLPSTANLPITINDDPADTVKMKVVPRISPIYKVTESTVPATVTITFDYVDSNGNPAPIEDSLDIDFLTPTAATTDTAEEGAGKDWTKPADGATTLAASAMGVGTISGTVTIATIDNTTPENLEVFKLLIKDNAGVASITSDTTTTIEVRIADNDKPELILVTDMSPLARRSKEDAKVWAITDETGAFEYTLTYLVHTLKDCRERKRKQGNDNLNYLELTLPRPTKNSKSRYNEYTFSKDQTFDTTTRTRTAHAFVSPTSHTEKTAPIESNSPSVLVVYPAGAGACAEATGLDQKYVISVQCTKPTAKSLVWEWIPAGGTKSDLRRLKNKGRSSYTIDKCNQAGLYILSRGKRGSKGWVEYIRVIEAACPVNMHTPGGCTAAPTCKNGGVVDQTLGLCCCPPGFAGTECELGLEVGTFGSNCQFKISDYVKEKQRKKGKCLKFSYPDTCGVFCAAGYRGNDCCDTCKKGTFGSGCSQTCHCIDDDCDTVSGACANGCLLGYSGFNCQ